MPPESVFQIPSSPVAALGTFTLIVAFLLSAYALAAGVAGHRTHRPKLVTSAVYASWAFTALMTLASCLMIYAFVSHDYTIKYVVQYSDTSMPLFYKITAYWGGLDGSLMFWVWILSIYSAAAIFFNYRRHPDLIGYIVATIAAIAIFFLGILIYVKNPFATYLTEVPFDGKGLNPLLQSYWMVIHPPSLYLGYVGMSVPFAFCIAALASGRLDDAWLHSVRVWVLITWFFLSLGLMLGGIWAYEELGWGGYWAWDPVENAGLFPWFTLTAFLHSVVMQERRGMLKIWNVVLVLTSFVLTIFGTFLTRSGIVQSVHAFGQDPQLAMLFILFMVVIIVFSGGLLLYRLPALRSSASIDSFVSREFAFLLNNWILVFGLVFVLGATMFPTLSEHFLDQRVALDPPFFDKWMTPVGLILLLMAGVGPLLAWKVTTRRRLLDQFLFPVAAMTLTTAAVGIFFPRWRVRSPLMSDDWQWPLALICLGFVAFTIAAMFQEFWRGAKARKKQTDVDAVSALVGVVLSKRRKYGGYIVHVGIALMFLGFAGKANTLERQVTLQNEGETFQAGPFSFKYDEFVIDKTHSAYTEWSAKFSVFRGTELISSLEPGRRQYRAREDEQMTTEVALDRRFDQDIYLVLNNFEPATKVINLSVFLNPLVNWVWFGFGMLAFGTGVCLVPESIVTAFSGRRRGRLGQVALAIGTILLLVGVSAVLLGMASSGVPAWVVQ